MRMQGVGARNWNAQRCGAENHDGEIRARHGVGPGEKDGLDFREPTRTVFLLWKRGGFRKAERWVGSSFLRVIKKVATIAVRKLCSNFE